jgi:hypothetical protein
MLYSTNSQEFKKFLKPSQYVEITQGGYGVMSLHYAQNNSKNIQGFYTNKINTCLAVVVEKDNKNCYFLHYDGTASDLCMKEFFNNATKCVVFYNPRLDWECNYNKVKNLCLLANVKKLSAFDKEGAGYLYYYVGSGSEDSVKVQHCFQSHPAKELKHSLNMIINLLKVASDKTLILDKQFDNGWVIDNQKLVDQLNLYTNFVKSYPNDHIVNSDDICNYLVNKAKSDGSLKEFVFKDNEILPRPEDDHGTPPTVEQYSQLIRYKMKDNIMQYLKTIEEREVLKELPIIDKKVEPIKIQQSIVSFEEIITQPNVDTASKNYIDPNMLKVIGSGSEPWENSEDLYC